jgi:hypothetical protein
MTLLTPLLVLVACGQPADCATLDGLERDACFDARVRAATGPDTVIAEARSIHDPLVRDAAVVAWVRAHRTELRPSDGRVCSVLTSTEQAGCARRLASPHLSR